MRIYGIDFTSRPSCAKPITCLACTLTPGRRLVAGELITWADFDGFEAALRRPGPWVAGIDFPFGQARRFVENIGRVATTSTPCCAPHKPPGPGCTGMKGLGLRMGSTVSKDGSPTRRRA
jgi:hypothetical protein